MTDPARTFPHSPTCVATFDRLRWASLRAGRNAPLGMSWHNLNGQYTLTIDEARQLCAAAKTSLASLYLPPTTLRERLAARIYGWRNR